MIEKRELGKNTGIQLNPLGLGCMGMSDFYGNDTDEETSLSVLKRALELGCNVWDTSDMYGLGENERLLGKFFAQNKDSREKVFLCTKFGVLRNQKTGAFTGVSGTPEYVRKSCDASLERLGVESIDLYYQHRPDPNTPIEDTVKALAELVKEGKVKYIGLSECDVETLRRAHKVHPITAYQIEYSPWTLDIETDGILEATRELGISIVAYSPLGRGFLTGAYKKREDFNGQGDIRSNHFPRFSNENFAKNMEFVNKIEVLAEKKGITTPEFILAWVLAQGNDFFVIPGTKRINYLEQNIKGGQIQLSDEELKEMRDIVDSATIAGDRYF